MMAVWALVGAVAVFGLWQSTGFVGHHFVGFRPATGCIVPGARATHWPQDFVFGDRILQIEGRAIAHREALIATYDAAPVGARLRHLVVRDGLLTTIVGRVEPFTLTDWINSALPFILFGVASGLLGLAVAVLGHRRPEARTFSFVCAAFFLAAMSNASCDLFPPLYLPLALSTSMIGGLILAFAAQLGPTKRLAVWPIVISALVGLLGYFSLPDLGPAVATEAELRQGWMLWYVATLYLPLLGLLGFVVLMGLNLRRLDPHTLQAQQSRLIFGAAATAFLPPIVVWMLPLFGGHVDPIMGNLSIFAFIAFPATVTIAVLRYKLFEIEVIIRRTLTYSVVGGLMALFYLGAMGTFVAYFGNGQSEFFRLALFAITTMTFNPLRSLVQRRLDRMFDRGRMSLLDVQRKISLRAAEHRDTTQTLEGVTRDLQDALKLTVCALGLVHEDQVWLTAGEPELLGTCLPINRLPSVAHWDRGSHVDFPWPPGIEAAYVITLRDRLLAVIFLGAKLSQEPLNSQDFDYLGLISGQIGLLLSYTQVLDRQAAVDREMQTLMRKVSELNDLRSSFGIVAGHELRTPLTVIRGHAEALLSGVFGDLDPEQEESVHSIFRSATSMTLQITSYLDLMALREKRLVLRPAHCDLGTILFELLESWTEELDAKNLHLRVDLGQAEKVYADARRIRQVVEQLLSNAVKFTPAGGSIVMSAETDALHVVLRIQDSGPGIAAEALERAFDDFAQVADPTRRDHGGLGLGLPLAKALLEAMQGWIDYTRSADGGSIFLCAMPLPAEVREQRRLRSGLFPAPSAHRLKTLEDPQTGLWKVFPEDDTPPQQSSGVTLEHVRYETAGNPADWQHPDADE
jgi:signal transduction histidine kinase